MDDCRHPLTINNSKSRRERESDSIVTTFYSSKCPVYKKNDKTYKEIGKYSLFTGKKIDRNFCSGSPDSGLTRQRLTKLSLRQV